MATFSAVFTPSGSGTGTTADLNASLAATTSTAAITLEHNRLFAINADGDINIRFGNSGMDAASGADYRIPAGTTAVYDLGNAFTRIRLYNPGGSSINYWIQPLVRAA